MLSSTSLKAADKKMLAYKRLGICLLYVAFVSGHACRFSRIFHMQVEKFGELWKNFTKYSLGADYLQV